MKITPKEIDKFYADFQEALKPLMKKYDVSIKLGRASYDDYDFTCKMSVVNNQSKEALQKEAFLANISRFTLFGFQADDYRREFTTINGEKALLLGFNLRAKKYPLLVEINGKEVTTTLGYLIMPEGRTVVIEPDMYRYY